MVRRHVVVVFLVSFLFVSGSGFLLLYIFFQEPQEVSIEKPGSVYESIELDMPVQVFLTRGVNSSEVSIVRRLFLNKWVSSNQGDLLKLIVYGQNAVSFQELKKLLEMAVVKEGACNAGCSVIQKAIKIIEDDEILTEHVNKSLKEGLPAQLHMLRGRMMNADKKTREYKKLKNEYRQALEIWIDKTHGALIDRIITKV